MNNRSRLGQDDERSVAGQRFRRAVPPRRATPLVVNERADVEGLLRASGLFAGKPRSGRCTAASPIATTWRHDHGEYVVRIPGERTALLGIDRAYEAEAAQRAAELGIGPGSARHARERRHVDDRAGRRSSSRADAVRRAPRRRRRTAPSIPRERPAAGAFPIHRVVEWHARDASATA